ncbi:hypothetical protein THRCLA_05657 [Thraustotheca clavata]|uniref:Uncharacterized protein n=1 Tax=Thraustotheca clavata TaxID=74557 RepID=A0A1V9ZVB4_9STRA|nr:hypothetical protein THRCLA_05657 [Thraustotheca clavata]
MSEQYYHQRLPLDEYGSMHPQHRSGLCMYKSGKCTNFRTLKQNGEPHSLCAYHRDKQNAHQRKSDRKARQRKAAINRSNTRHHSFDYTPPASMLPPLPTSSPYELKHSHSPTFKLEHDQFDYSQAEWPAQEELVSPWTAAQRLPSIYELLRSRASSI